MNDPMTGLSVSEVIAKYQTMLNGFYQLPADKLDTIPVGDMESVARENTIAFFKNRDGITLTEEQLMVILERPTSMELLASV